MAHLSLISPQFPGVPSRINVVTQMPVERAKPGINYFIPTAERVSGRQVSKFIYMVYDEGAEQAGHFSASEIAFGLFPDVHLLSPKDADDALTMGYNVALAYPHYYQRLRMSGEEMVPEIGFDPCLTISLAFIVMKCLDTMSWVVRDLLDDRQSTFPTIESRRQLELAGSLHLRLSEIRTRKHEGRGTSHLAKIDLRAAGEFITVSLVFGHWPSREMLAVDIDIQREKPLLWYVRTAAHPFFTKLLSTARYAYPQLIAVPETLNGHFLLDESILMVL
jgi:hypothetical protein